ncbi:MAG: hypothetical protein ACK55Z_26545, partial [bacterium]
PLTTTPQPLVTGHGPHSFDRMIEDETKCLQNVVLLTLGKTFRPVRRKNSADEKKNPASY